jgi:hypothetical protein
MPAPQVVFDFGTRLGKVPDILAVKYFVSTNTCGILTILAAISRTLSQ